MKTTLKYPGRPRDSVKHAAVLSAIRELLREVGYRNLTVHAIAKRAGVSRPLIYSWWSGSKLLLIAEAIIVSPDKLQSPNLGDLESDLTSLIQQSVEQYTDPGTLQGFLGMSLEMLDDKKERHLVQDAFTAPYAELWHQVIQRASKRGEITKPINTLVLMHSITGALQELVRMESLTHEELTPYLTQLALIQCK